MADVSRRVHARGASHAIGPASKTVRWVFNPGGRFNDHGTSPVVGANGTIYLLQGRSNAGSSRLTAVSPVTHEKLWSWSDESEGAAFRSTPAVAHDGTVYVVSDSSGEALIAISNTGSTLWTLGGLLLQGSPTIGPDGTVYVESGASVLYAVNPQDGQVYWQFAGSEGAIGVRGSTALSPDGQTLYLPSGGGDLYALSAGPSGGSLEWTYAIEGPVGGGIENAPAVGR